MGTSFILFFNHTSEQDKFNENINLITQNLEDKNIDLDAYVDISLKQIAALISDSKVIANERMKDGNTEYHQIIYSGKQGKFSLIFVQRCYIVKKESVCNYIYC
ncbi:MAG: hypothetical protein NZM35_12325 [Chitinophagales bacterium]|nr:hypothetical protein [Chitinophagales bacterium]MDW8418163.1 hypothetical protein [Chitinophagales bacterium]